MNSKWNKYSINEVLSHDVESLEDVAIDKVYQMVGVYSYGKGLFDKEELVGLNTSYKSFYRLRAEHIVMSQLFGWEGAIAMCNREFEGKYVSSQFPTFVVNPEIADRDFVGFYLQTKKLWLQLFSLGKGMGSRRRTLNPRNLLSLDICLPDLPEQQRVVSKIQSIKANTEQIKKLRKRQEKELRQLIFSRFIQIIEGCQKLPFSEVAPINRKAVEIAPETTYQEVGARSFGKGLFDKPSFKGKDLTWQQPYWIHSGDLVFSNIKAWEGAVAVATDAAHLKVASHRYLTYTPNKDVTSAEFLCYYFLTPEGLEILGKASPGSADRNRTLNTRLLNNIMIPIPSPEVQLEFLEFKNKMETVQKHHAATLKELDELFPSLLDKAFKGEL